MLPLFIRTIHILLAGRNSRVFGLEIKQCN